MTRRWLAAGVLLVVLGLAGVFGFRAWQRSQEADRAVAVQDFTPSGANPGEAIETVETTDVALPTGGTPMAQRVAVVGLLNKRNGISRDLTLKPGQAVRVDDAIVRLRACEHTAPWEQDQLTGAFVQLDVRGSDRQWRRTFSGWLFKERPALNVVQHPIYDLWPKSCTMRFPETGPDTVSVPSTGGSRSSAKKSGGDSAGAAPSEPAASEPSAAANSTE